MIVHTISKFHIFVRAAVYKQINITTSSLCSILFKFLIFFFFFLEMRIGGGGISITISQDSCESTVLGRVLYCLNDMIPSAGCLGVSPPAMSNRSLITVTPQCTCKKKNRRNNVMERNNPFKTWAVV